MMNNADTNSPSDGVGSSSKRDTFLPQVEDVAYEDNDSSIAKERFFDTLAVEIGDEVTVPSTPSPLTFHSITDSDHSYFSAHRFLETNTAGQLRFPDCALSGETALLEFPDLFDFSVLCQPFDLVNSGGNEQLLGVELQEQVIESCSSTRDSESFQNVTQDWIQIQDGESTDSKESEGESDDGNSIDDDQNEKFTCGNNSTEKSQVRERRKPHGHHTGPLPQTFISEPWDRRARFCFSLQTIVIKIKNLMARTGAKANFKTEFENHVFTLDNVETLMRFTDRNKAKATSTSVKSCLDNSVLSNDPDGDHLYAATILTQTESSGVKDHQYNEVSTSQDQHLKGTKARSIQKSFIRTRYARERFLKKAAATIFSKLQRLVNRTGAKMNLAIEYENVVINHRNYTDIDKLIGRSRSHKSVHHSHEQTISTDETETLVSVTDDGSGPVPYSFDSMAFLESPPGSHQEIYHSAVESDHDYDMQSNHRTAFDSNSRAFTGATLRKISSGSCMGNADSTVAQDSSTSNGRKSLSPPLETAQNATDTNIRSRSNSSYRFDNSAATMSLSITNPQCQECGKTESKATLMEIGKHPPWIRCANPLCQYLVHPGCIGFVVLNTQHLQYLPPYYCPSHRD